MIKNIYYCNKYFVVGFFSIFTGMFIGIYIGTVFIFLNIIKCFSILLF